MLFSFVDYVAVKGEIIWYLSLTAWLISLSIMLHFLFLERFFHREVNGIPKPCTTSEPGKCPSTSNASWSFWFNMISLTTVPLFPCWQKPMEAAGARFLTLKYLRFLIPLRLLWAIPRWSSGGLKQVCFSLLPSQGSECDLLACVLLNVCRCLLAVLD